jgi:hypothetical protein
MSLLSKNSFLEEIDLNNSIEYLRNSISSLKEELNIKAKSSIDLINKSCNKRKSKISMKIEENNQKENIEHELDEEDYFSDFDENCISYECHEINNNHTEIKKFNIYFFFEYNKRKKYIIPISTESFNANNIHIIELIKYVIYKINNSNIMIKYDDIDYSISLKDLVDNEEEEEKLKFYKDNYEIKPFEFWTKNNCTSYNTSSLLSEIKEENIIFSSKNTLNVMLVKKF